MPLTAKGQEILAGMKKQYGDKKGEEVFYASRNAGKITGVDEAGDEAPRAAGVMVADPGGRLLFMRRKDDGTWAWPAGRIEGKETPAEAAQRELNEETGLTAGNLNQVDVGSGFVTFKTEVGAAFEPDLEVLPL